MESTKKPSNKIMEIVRLQQLLKRWKKLAVTPQSSTSAKKSINFLKRPLPLSDISYNEVPKGYLAACIGKEMKRFVIPTGYLAHGAFGVVLRDAEEEFGFQQRGMLRIPCEVSVFETILNVGGQEKGLLLLFRGRISTSQLSSLQANKQINI